MPTIDFQLNATQKICIVVPDFVDKINYYYEPTEEVHKFDEVKVCFFNLENKVELCEDVLNEVLGAFYTAMQNALSGSIKLPHDIKPGDVGRLSNYAFRGVYDDYSSSVLVWCSQKKVQTFIYRLEDRVYLEISPIYPWHFEDPLPDEKYISFDEFMKEYKPYFVIEISQSVMQLWVEQAEIILKKVGWSGFSA